MYAVCRLYVCDVFTLGICDVCSVQVINYVCGVQVMCMCCTQCAGYVYVLYAVCSLCVCAVHSVQVKCM